MDNAKNIISDSCNSINTTYDTLIELKKYIIKDKYDKDTYINCLQGCINDLKFIKLGFILLIN